MHPIRLTAGILLAFLSLTSQAYGQTYVVTTTLDNVTTPPPGSLRDAINQVNSTAYDTINFHIPKSDFGYDRHEHTWTIKPQQDLPPITQKVTIDGYSQPGSSENTHESGDNAVLTIVINGSNYRVGNAATSGAGLTLASGSAGSSISGLVINEFISAGIFINGITGGADGTTIRGNFIGTNARGTEQKANAAGVYIYNANNTVIGGVTPKDRNLIAGSFGTWNSAPLFVNGLFVGGSIAIFAGTATKIIGNYVGLDHTGTKSLGNSQIGIAVGHEFTPFFGYSAANTQIGGISVAERNIISGHEFAGISIVATYASVQGNYIGTDHSGTKPLGSTYAGVYINSLGDFAHPFIPVENNIIGGVTPGAGNLISGNGNGIVLGLRYNQGASNNSVLGNFIGTDFSGKHALPNTCNGIIVTNDNNAIGNGSASGRNVISGNGNNGILVYSATGISIQGNYIGVTADGECPLGNKGNGVQLGMPAAGASGNTVGGLQEGQGNVISANGKHGVFITSYSDNNIVQGNTIGYDAKRKKALPNKKKAIKIVCSSGNVIKPNCIKNKKG